MNTAVTLCPRCTGKEGAHYAFCFVAEVWERLFGDRFPWMPPTTPAPDPEPDWDWSAEIPPPEEPPGDPLRDDVDHRLPPFREPPAADPGVMEDFLVMAGAVESDADWYGDMHDHWEQWHADRQLDEAIHVEAVTHLPDDYFGPSAEPGATGVDSVDNHGQLVIEEPKVRVRNTDGLRRAREAFLHGQEDAAVQFVYDRCEFVPGGRVLLNDLHREYVAWHKANDRPSMSKPRLQALLVELGVQVEGGRLPGGRTSGKAPLLVHGLTLRQEVKPQSPKVAVKPEPKRRDKHALIGCKPGGELPKQLRDLIEPLITQQGWEYQPHSGSGHGKPRVIAPDGKTVTLPSTPHLQGRTLENTRSFLKQNGAAL